MGGLTKMNDYINYRKAKSEQLQHERSEYEPDRAKQLSEGGNEL
jgi:hypothetical protein